MAYLTKSNINRIMSKADLGKMELKGGIYKRRIYFFNMQERQRLLAYYLLYKNPEAFASIYVKIQNEDTFSFVFEGGTPAYHFDSSCSKLVSDFINFKIPKQIKDAGSNTVLEFRSWFRETETQKLLIENEERFLAALHLRFIKYIPSKPEPVRYKNTGYQAVENVNLEGLEFKINNLLDEADAFRQNSSSVIQRAIIYFEKHTYLARTGKPIPNDLPNPETMLGIKEEELRLLLIDYENKFKVPVSELLKDYYRIKFNPDLKFEGLLLDQLGLKKCATCFTE